MRVFFSRSELATDKSVPEKRKMNLHSSNGAPFSANDAVILFNISWIDLQEIRHLVN